MNDSTTTSPLKEATTALDALMMAQRFQVVVERVRKQVRSPKGEKPRSSWIATSDFHFHLFEGASITLDTEKATALSIDLSGALQRILTPFRQPLLDKAIGYTSKSVTLAGSKSIKSIINDLNCMDCIGYQCTPISNTHSMVSVVSPAPVRLSGDDRVMNTLCAEANKALADVMQPFVDDLTDALRTVIRQLK